MICMGCMNDKGDNKICPICGLDDSIDKIMFCGKCGEKLIKGKKFCSKCGSEIKPQIKSSTEDTSTKPDSPIYEKSHDNNQISKPEVPIAEDKKPISKTNMYIIFAALALVIIAITAATIYFIIPKFFTKSIVPKNIAAVTSKQDIIPKPDVVPEPNIVSKPDSNTSEATMKDSEQSVLSAQSSKKAQIDNMQKEIKNLLSSGKGEYSVVYQDLKDGNTMNINSNKTKAASVIKLYIMIEALDQIKHGNMNGNEEIVLSSDMKVGGTGILQSKPEGTRVSMNDAMGLMIDNSDNTAANILIDRLGMDNINRMITSLGCTDTYLQRKLMDTESIKEGKENYTSAKDLSMTLNKIYKSQCLGEVYDKQMIEIMKKQTNNTKIPSTLPKGLQIAHKTGELDGVENDAGIIFCPEGDYSLCILTDGTINTTAIKTDGAISKIVYEYNKKINGQ